MEEKLATIRHWLGEGSINIFGMPFAGKDTQGGVLADLLGAELLGGGMILRNSVIPPHVKQIMDGGGLIPIEDYLQIVPPYLSQDAFAAKPLVLSSVGRWDGEQHGVLQATELAGHPTKAVVLLTVPKEVALARHSKAVQAGDRGNRADDSEEVFERRIHEYTIKTLPVIEFYKDKGLLIEVDGTAEPPQVTEDILDSLLTIATA